MVIFKDIVLCLMPLILFPPTNSRYSNLWVCRDVETMIKAIDRCLKASIPWIRKQKPTIKAVCQSLSEIRFIPLQSGTQISCSATAVGRVNVYKEIKIIVMLFIKIGCAIALTKITSKMFLLTSNRHSLKSVVCCIYVSDSLCVMCMRTTAFC